MKILIVLFAVKLVFVDARTCQFDKQFKLEGTAQIFLNENDSTFSFFDLPQLSSFANQSLATAIPREIVIFYLKPHCGFSVQLSNIHHPKTWSRLIVKSSSSSDFNSSCKYQKTFFRNAI